MQKLDQKIGFWSGLALAFSLVVGSGLLGVPGITIEKFGADVASTGWIVTIIALTPLIYIFTRLGCRFQSAGGLSNYATQALGEWGGSAVSYLILGSFLLGVPFTAIIVAAYAQELFGLPESYITWLALGTFLLVLLVNLVTVRTSSLINLVSMVVLLGLTIILVSTNIPYLKAGIDREIVVLSHFTSLSFSSVWKCSLVIFWAFIGWEELSFGLEEFTNPKKNIFRVYWASFLCIAALYLFLGLTAAGASAAGLNIAGPGGIGALIGGKALARPLLALMVLVAFANTNANVFAYSRLVFAGGREGIFPRYLGQLSNRRLPVSSLANLTLIFCLVVLAIRYLKIDLAGLIALVDQNFVVLYLFAIYAFWKTEKGPSRWVISSLSVLSCACFVSSLGWRLLYPTALIGIGYLRHRATLRTRRRGAEKSHHQIATL